MGTSTVTYESLTKSPFFRRFCRLMCETTGLALMFVDSRDQRRQWLDARQDELILCRYMRGKSAFLAQCTQCDRRRMAQAAEGKRGRSYICHAGLVDIVVPVVINDTHVGTFIGGQVHPRKPTEARFKAFTKAVAEHGFDRDKLRRLYFATPWIGRGRIKDLLALIGLFASHFEELGSRLIEPGRPHDAPLERAVAYINEHLREPITLETVSRAAGVAPAYLSRLFKQERGENYTALVRRLRVAHAQRLMRNEERSMLWVSLESGFGSLRSFNRAFKTVTGNSPSAWLALSQAARANEASGERSPWVTVDTMSMV